MRLHGVVRTATGLGLHGHACWAFSDDEELRRGVADFLADGPGLGQRLLYAGVGSTDELRARLRELDGADDLIAGGGLEIISLSSLYDDEARTSTDAVLKIYARETERALADGFRGLRVAADATSLVLDEANWDDHVRWEAFADRYSAVRPVAALCGYDRRRLPDAIVGDLACVHAATNAPVALAPFRIASSGAGEALHLEGELDYFAALRLRRMFELALPDGERTVLDLSGVTFADHHGVLVLAEQARRQGLLFRDVPYPVRRIADMVGARL